MHPTELDPVVMEAIVARCADYNVDSFEICAQCHTLLGGMDGLVLYDDFPTVTARINREAILANRQVFRKVLSIAHNAGKPVYYWHREVMVPSGLLEDMPDLLDKDGEFDMLGEAFAKLLRYKISETFRVVPELDGLVLTLTEADYSAIHNSNAENYPPVKVVEHIVEIFATELEKRGKRLIVRSFGSIAKDYEDILAGTAPVALRHKLEVETKITPYDFDIFLPMNPFLNKLPGATLGAECDGLGEFMGAGFLPLDNVDANVSFVRAGQKAQVDRYVIRMDRIGNSVFDVHEMNLYAFMRAIEDTAVTAEQIRAEWSAKHYPAEIREALQPLDQISYELITKTYFIDQQAIFHGNYCLKYLQAAFVPALFKNGASLANGAGIWSILTERPAPGREKILQEKDQAVALAEKGCALLKSLPGTPAALVNRWENALVVTQAIRALMRVLAAYFEDMEAGDDSGQNFKAQVASALSLLNQLASGKLSIQEQRVFNGMDHWSGSKFTVIDICVEPIATICTALVELYDAEVAARKKFMPNSTDCVIPGGLLDDWRIARYMHGSHAVVHQGLPSRWAGNQVFPNGFFQLTMARAAKLVLYGAIDETPDFALLVDGVRQQHSFDGDGVCVVTLPSGGPEVHLRLEKVGRIFPRFYALVTQD